MCEHTPPHISIQNFEEVSEPLKETMKDKVVKAHAEAIKIKELLLWSRFLWSIHIEQKESDG